MMYRIAGVFHEANFCRITINNCITLQVKFLWILFDHEKRENYPPAKNTHYMGIYIVGVFWWIMIGCYRKIFTDHIQCKNSPPQLFPTNNTRYTVYMYVTHSMTFASQDYDYLLYTLYMRQ